MTDCGLLDGRDEISAFLNGAGVKKLNRWRAAGMPIRTENGRWLAHKENIDEWFKHYTRLKKKGEK